MLTGKSCITYTKTHKIFVRYPHDFRTDCPETFSKKAVSDRFRAFRGTVRSLDAAGGKRITDREPSAPEERRLSSSRAETEALLKLWCPCRPPRRIPVCFFRTSLSSSEFSGRILPESSSGSGACGQGIHSCRCRSRCRDPPSARPDGLHQSSCMHPGYPRG